MGREFWEVLKEIGHFPLLLRGAVFEEIKFSEFSVGSDKTSTSVIIMNCSLHDDILET
jgi:hypothetical protein